MSLRPTYSHLQIEPTSCWNLRCRTCLYATTQSVSPDQAGWPVYPDTAAGRTRWFGLRLSVLWRRSGRGLPSVKKQPTPVCPKNPLVNLFVGADGTVSPGVNLTPPLKTTVPRCRDGRLVESPRLIMGRFAEQPLDAIWLQPAYQAWEGFPEALRRLPGPYGRHPAESGRSGQTGARRCALAVLL